MDSFLDRYQVPKLNQYQINDLNNSIIPKEIEVVINRTRWVQCRVLSDIQRRPNTNTLQAIPQNRNIWNTTQFVL